MSAAALLPALEAEVAASEALVALLQREQETLIKRDIPAVADLLIVKEGLLPALRSWPAPERACGRPDTR